jgi:hypothetical protein
MSSADAYIYNETYENEVPEKPFTSREIQIVYDVNNGVYTNQVIFSTQSLTNGGKYADFQNSYIEIPFTLAMSSGADALTNPNSFMAGIKDGSIQLVDSIICQYNGTSVVLNQIFTNVIQHFKILSSWTYEDLLKYGPSTMTWPDNTESMRYTGTAGGAFGDGVSNNQISGFNYTGLAASPDNSAWKGSLGSFNEGLLRRQRGVIDGANGNNSIKSLNSQKASNVTRNWFENVTGNTYVWNIMLTLRLKDLADFFNHIPILKASRIDLTINFNASYGSFKYTPAVSATTDGTMYSTALVQTAGHTTPYIVTGCAVATGASKTTSQPWANVSGGERNVYVGCGINGVTNAPSQLSGLSGKGGVTNCRWYIPMFEMNPEYEQNLIVKNPIKTIYYDDFYTYTNLTNQSGTFSSLLTAGVKNPKYLVVFPFFNSASASSGNVLNISPYQSFFDTAPATASPVSLTSFQVQVGGRNMFNNIQQYNFQQYLDEFSSIFALNGGKSDILTSGLYTQTMWENAPIYVCDISRRLPQDDGSPKSVQISATINSSNPSGVGTSGIDFICFVVFGRSVSFNIINGLIENAAEV